MLMLGWLGWLLCRERTDGERAAGLLWGWAAGVIENLLLGWLAGAATRRPASNENIRGRIRIFRCRGGEVLRVG